MTSMNIYCAWIAWNILPKRKSALGGMEIQRRRIAMLTSDPTPVVPIIDHSEVVHRRPKPKQDKIEQTLAQIRALHEVLNSQLYAYPMERPQINSPADAANLLTPFIGNLDHEELWVVNMDTRNRVKTWLFCIKAVSIQLRCVWVKYSGSQSQRTHPRSFWHIAIQVVIRLQVRMTWLLLEPLCKQASSWTSMCWITS